MSAADALVEALSNLQQAVAFQRQVSASADDTLSNGAQKDAHKWVWEAAQAAADAAPPQQPAQPAGVVDDEKAIELALRSAIDQFGPERLARAIAQRVAKVTP